MKNEIKDKIENTIRNKDYSEAGVVYLLTQSYKFLEKEKRLDEFGVIRFYRNWACHSYLSGDTMKIFKKVHVLNQAREYKYIKNNLEFTDIMSHEIEKSFSKYSPKFLKNEIDIFF